jgi:hypothetical protein
VTACRHANDEGDHGKGSQLEQHALEKHLVNAIDAPLDVADTSLAPLISIPHLSFDPIEPPVYAIDTPVLSHDVSSSAFDMIITSHCRQNTSCS